jgi:DNA-binding CsgD family transcriptional regulator
MDLSEPSFLRFIELIYDAVERPQQWRELFEQLRHAIGTKSIHMLGLDKQQGALSYSEGANLPVEGELAYMQQYLLIDPRVPMITGKPTFAWTHCPQELPPELVDTHPLYQELLLPHDRGFMSACKLLDTPEATIIFSTLGGAREGPLTPAAIAFLDRLLPHLARACRLGIRNFVYSTQALVGHLLVDKLRQPVILMTSGGGVLHTNQAAQELLRSTDLVRVDEGKLQLPVPQMRDLLQRCASLEQAIKVEGEAAAAAAGFQSLRIESGAGGESLYAFFTVLSPNAAMGSFGLRPVVMLMFYHPRSAPAIDANLLYAVFGLTPAECRIAVLLAEGLSLKQIANELGTQYETVRKQLGSIYQKTATNRQPELIRLLLHLPHNAAQG